MKAVVLNGFGGPEQLQVQDLPDPVAGPGQVRIAVRACGTNPVDAQNRVDGDWAGLAAGCVLGYDVAGVVDQVGPGVDLEPTAVRLGDRVMAMTRFPGGAGGYAEFVLVGADQVARIDDSTSFVEAAATPLAAGTAYLVLDRLGLAEGDRLLLLGAGGGVGLFLLQLAKAAGISTVAVGRAGGHKRMRALGATWCIDYTSEDVVTRALTLAGGPVDAIADLVGGPLAGTCLPALRNGGAIASIATPEFDLDLILDHNLSFHGVLIQDDGDRTRELAALLAQGVLHPVLSRVLPLAEVAQAHQLLDGGHPGGKVVLTL